MLMVCHRLGTSQIGGPFHCPGYVWCV